MKKITNIFGKIYDIIEDEFENDKNCNKTNNNHVIKIHYKLKDIKENSFFERKCDKKIEKIPEHCNKINCCKGTGTICRVKNNDIGNCSTAKDITYNTCSNYGVSVNNSNKLLKIIDKRFFNYSDASIFTECGNKIGFIKIIADYLFINNIYYTTINNTIMIPELGNLYFSTYSESSDIWFDGKIKINSLSGDGYFKKVIAIKMKNKDKENIELQIKIESPL